MMLSNRATRVSDRATNVETFCHDTARLFVQQHGRQRGLHAFARACGITERRARSLLDRTAARIDATEYLAVQDARLAITQDRAARLRQELEALTHVAMVRPAADQDVGLVHHLGGLVPAAGPRAA